MPVRPNLYLQHSYNFNSNNNNNIEGRWWYGPSKLFVCNMEQDFGDTSWLDIHITIMQVMTKLMLRAVRERVKRHWMQHFLSHLINALPVLLLFSVVISQNYKYKERSTYEALWLLDLFPHHSLQCSWSRNVQSARLKYSSIAYHKKHVVDHKDSKKL